MKKLAHLSLALLIQGLISLPAAQAAVSIDSTGGNATLGSTLALNINIDGTGAVSTPSPLFALSGNLTEPGAFGGTVGVTFDAAKDMSTNSLDLTIGNELTDGNLQRDANGFLGVNLAPNGGGIGSDGIIHEGITILFDELTDIDPSVGVRITGINVQNVGRVGTDPDGESFTIVNLITHASLTFEPLAESLSAGTFDVSSLDIYRVGGDAGEVAAILSGDIGGFRIDGFTFETFAVQVPEPSTLALLGLGGMLLMLRKRISLRG